MKKQTHEQFIQQISETVIHLANVTPKVKITYGAGNGRYRGICYYSAWQNGSPEKDALIEISAFGEESPIQIAGTIVHELAHAVAGFKAGHGPDWKKAAELLGLRNPLAAGQKYLMSGFKPDLRFKLIDIPIPTDGKPSLMNNHDPWGLVKVGMPKPCPLGIGVRGGKSRGKGSGSRLRLYHCSCNPPVKVRVSSDDFRAKCLNCDENFNLV